MDNNRCAKFANITHYRITGYLCGPENDVFGSNFKLSKKIYAFGRQKQCPRPFY